MSGNWSTRSVYFQGRFIQSAVDVSKDGGILKGGESSEGRIRLSLPLMFQAGDSFVVCDQGQLRAVGEVIVCERSLVIPEVLS